MRIARSSRPEELTASRNSSKLRKEIKSDLEECWLGVRDGSVSAMSAFYSVHVTTTCTCYPATQRTWNLKASQQATLAFPPIAATYQASQLSIVKSDRSTVQKVQFGRAMCSWVKLWIVCSNRKNIQLVSPSSQRSQVEELEEMVVRSLGMAVTSLAPALTTVSRVVPVQVQGQLNRVSIPGTTRRFLTVQGPAVAFGGMLGMMAGTPARAQAGRTISEAEEVLKNVQWPEEFPFKKEDFSRYDE